MDRTCRSCLRRVCDLHHRDEHVGECRLEPDPVRPPAVLAFAGAASTRIRLLALRAFGKRRLVDPCRRIPDDFDHPMMGANLPQSACSGHGLSRLLGLCFGDLSLPRARLHPPDDDGQLVGSGALRDLPTPGLDGSFLDPLRQPVLQSVPRAIDRVPVWLDPAVCDARCDDPCGHTLWR
uniref:Photosynthetic reaction centre M subunit n=1 Tax=uncultured Alphaproteobacteria bacterium TaxID=91750 RepID=B5DC68_9PROT|nr:photosynthetic reaction centre M subunit [uncultured Alphaproteobacteria bacterium]